MEVSAQAKEIKALKAQVKKLKKGVKPLITHHKAWIKSVALKTRLARKTSLKKKGSAFDDIGMMMQWTVLWRMRMLKMRGGQAMWYFEEKESADKGSRVPEAIFITRSQNKQKEGKRVEIRNVEDTRGPRLLQQGSVLTLKAIQSQD
ncbi:hypothetical protein Tco_0684015 [Tanacetum coccineum]